MRLPAVPVPTPLRSRASTFGLALVLLVGAVLVGLHVHSYRQLSQYDEANHVDYVYNLLNGDIPVSGDRWLPSTTQAVACRTIDAPFPYPPCTPAADNGQMPNYGMTTEFIQTPLYYVLPAVGVWASDSILPFDVDQISAMRATNYLWLVAGVLLLWMLLADLRVPWMTRAGLSLCLISAPTLLLISSTVTNDGAALAAGAAITCAVLRWSAGRLRTWVLVAIVAVALLLKATSLAIVLMACAFAVVRTVQRSTRRTQAWRDALSRRNVVLVASCVAATVLIAFGWSALQASWATLNQMVIAHNVSMSQDAFNIAWLPGAVLSVVEPLAPQWTQSVMTGTIGSTAALLVSSGLFVLAVIGAVRTRPGSELRALAISTGLAAITFGPLMVLSNYASMGIWFDIPARYGLTLLAPMAALAALALRARLAQLTVLGVGLTTCAAVAVHLVLV